MKFIENLPADTFQNHLPHTLYADNFFLSLKLIDQLTKMNIGITGTTRANRIGDCPIESVQKFKKCTLGSHAIQYDRINKVLICRYKDNAIVTAASNWDTITPVNQTEWYSRSFKKKVTIDQPQPIENYNLNMGGTDRCNQNAEKYRINVHGRKWYWPLIL